MPIPATGLRDEDDLAFAGLPVWLHEVVLAQEGKSEAGPERYPPRNLHLHTDADSCSDSQSASIQTCSTLQLQQQRKAGVGGVGSPRSSATSAYAPEPHLHVQRHLPGGDAVGHGEAESVPSARPGEHGGDDGASRQSFPGDTE